MYATPLTAKSCRSTLKTIKHFSPFSPHLPHLALELDGGAGRLVQDLLARVVEAVREPLKHHQPHEHHLRVIATGSWAREARRQGSQSHCCLSVRPENSAPPERRPALHAIRQRNYAQLCVRRSGAPVRVNTSRNPERTGASERPR